MTSISWETCIMVKAGEGHVCCHVSHTRFYNKTEVFQLPWKANNLFARGCHSGVDAGLGLTTGWCVATALSSRLQKSWIFFGMDEDASSVKQRWPAPLSFAPEVWQLVTNLECSEVTDQKVPSALHSSLGKFLERWWVFHFRLTTGTKIFMCRVHSV